MGPGLFIFGVSNAAAGRILAHLFPTPLEKAQINALTEQVRIVREQLVAADRRAQQDIDARRDMLREQLSHQQALQDQRIEAEKDIVHLRNQIEAWPLAVTAIDILSASRRRVSPILNVIVKISAGRNEEDLKRIENGVDALDRMSRSFIGDDVLIYVDGPTKATVLRNRSLSGQSLVATLSNRLYTEPTAVLEVKPGKNALLIDGAFWGWSCEVESERYTARRGPQTFNLPLPEAADAAEQTILTALSLLVVGIRDAYMMLNHWDRAPGVRLFDAIAALRQRAALEAENEGPFVSELIKLFDTLAERAPALAAEAAARAALDAHQSGQAEYASVLLGTALRFARSAVRNAPASDEGLIQTIMAVPRNEYGILQEALIRLRDAVPIEKPPEDEPRPSLSEIVRGANKKLRGNES